MTGRQSGTGTGVPPGDLRLVADAFALGSIRGVRFIPEGLINRNWQVTADRGVFALKQITDVPLPQSRRNLRVVTALPAAGVPACRPVITVNGDTVAEAEGRGYCLSWWVEGQHLHGRELSADQVHHAGAMLARVHQGLHRAGPRTALPTSTRRPTATTTAAARATVAADQFLTHIARLPAPQPWDLAVAESLKRRKELLRTYAHHRPGSIQPPGPSGWTHGDFHSLNLIWRHGQIAGIVDWNRIGIRTFSEEVARSATLLFSDDDGQIDLNRIAAFVAGYQAVIPLRGHDLADAVNRRWWKLMCDYRYLDFHYGQDDPSCDSLVGPAARLLEWWTSHRQQVTASFVNAEPDHPWTTSAYGKVTAPPGPL